ncbi:MAG: protein kinase domain-containing protein [Gemmatimonadaceae bacterium]
MVALAFALSGRYEISEMVGAGGMAVVYRARDLQRDRTIALKVLRPEITAFDASERFLREIGVIARLVHPHILPLLDSGEAAGLLWYSMPFIEGESLRAYLDRARQLSLDEAVRLTGEIAGALSYAHGKGILHRDIKPETILLAAGHALVADFGIARVIAAETNDALTGTGVSMGTPAYMSPEQSVGERQLDARSDVYALGAVCYEMLVGEPPFTGPTAQAVIARRLSLPPPSLRSARPGVSEGIDNAIRRALALAPADRFDSASEFGRALSVAAIAMPTSAPSSSSRHRPSLQVTGRRLGAVVSLAGAVAAAAFLAHRHGKPAAPIVGAAHAATNGVRLAVLPFRFIGDSAHRYLAEGLSEEIDATLANLGGLRVIAQSSVAPVAAKATSMRAIGEALGADALITGDVQRSANELRVRVQFIDAATEDTRWSKEFDESTQNLFRIQSEVAQQVAALLRIQLAQRESRSLGRPLTTNPAAYDLYLRARTLASRPGNETRARYDTTIAQLTRAIGLDSSFAAAWGLRAMERTDLAFYLDAGAPALDGAEFDIRRALALDSSSVTAWQAMSNVAWTAARGWNFQEALAASYRAIAAQPSDVSAHENLGALLLHYGFMEEAGVEFATSLSLDPRDGCETTRCVGFSPPRVARVFWYRQRFDSALAIYRGFPPGAWPVWEYAVLLGTIGKPADGLALLDSAGGLNSTSKYDPEAAAGLMYAMLGRREDALVQLRLAGPQSEGRSHSHHAQFTLACAYARLGDTREAVQWLERTADNGMPNYPLFRNDPNLRGLRGIPAYEALMTRLEQQFDANRRLVRKLRGPARI